MNIITVIGQLRYGEPRSIPEIHQRLVQQGEHRPTHRHLPPSVTVSPSLRVRGVAKGKDLIRILPQLPFLPPSGSSRVSIAQRIVTDLLEHYEELVAQHLADEERIKARLKQQSVDPVQLLVVLADEERIKARLKQQGQMWAMRSSG